MWIYKIFRDEENVDWDEHAGFVVIASSEAEARILANSEGRDGCARYYHQDWLDVQFAQCQCIGRALPNQETAIVMIDFNAG